MTTNFQNSARRSLRRPGGGFALVIVMFMLALVLILVIAFAANMRTERKAAHNMAQSQRATLLAESALAHAVSLLANNIPDPGDPTVVTPVGSSTNWLINPGQLTLIDSSSPPNITHIPLHTGAASAQDPIAAVNLNAQSPVTQNYYITGANDPMWVSWVPVLQDASAPASQSNPLIGRYAFWIDDECAKINFNTARGKPDMTTSVALPPTWKSDMRAALTPTFSIGSGTFALGQPGSVNLDILGLSSTAIGNLDDAVGAQGFFTEPQAIKSFAGTGTSAQNTFYEQNKFQLTPFSRAPEFNVFGLSRIFMGQTAGNLTTGPIYQHLGTPAQPLQFWGWHAGVGDGTGSNLTRMREMREQAVSVLARYLRRTDWPGMGTRTFRWNLDPLGDAESDQIALNIASMGYLATTPIEGSGGVAESPQLINAYSRWSSVNGAYPAIATNPDASLWKGPLTGKPMLPNSLFPHISEITCNVQPLASGTTGDWKLKYDFDIELHQPPANFSRPHPTTGGIGFNNSSLLGGNYYSYITLTHLIVTASTASGTVYRNTMINQNSSQLPKDAEIPHGGFQTMTIPTYTSGTVSTTSNQIATGTATLKYTPTTPGFATFNSNTTVSIKARFALTVGGTGNYLQQVIPIYVPLATAGPSEVRPPSGNDEEAYLDFTFTLPGVLDPLGNYAQSREALDPRMLASKANWAITSGSPNALHSGASAYDSAATKWASCNMDKNYLVLHDSNKKNARGTSIGMFSLIPSGIQRSVPFETLRFHRTSWAATELPDWVILDLLAPTFPAPISLRNSTAGKINLNTKIYPDNANFAPPARTAPLDAVFHNMPNGSNAAAAIRNYSNSGGYFDYIGRICDVPGVADTALGPTEFEQETLIRHLASLMTTQSNTFSVWGVAQTVKKSPNNTNYGIFQNGDTVTGERRFRAVVERQVWPGKDGTPGNASVTSDGQYDKVASGTALIKNPGAPPSMASANYPLSTWPEIDGPQQSGTMAPSSTVGTVPYSNTSLENANNPLAAAMKYRIIFWEYLD